MDLVSLLTSTTSKGNPNAWDISKAYYEGPGVWDLSKAYYWGESFSVATEETTPAGLFFKPDGTKMYVCGASGDDVNEYNLSIPWIISTASYVQNFSVANEDGSPRALFFKPDGTKMYIVGRFGQDVNEYNLSSAWNISTASYLQNFSVASQETEPQGLFFKPDGTKMYVSGFTNDNVNEYDMSSAWDISTASYVQSFSVASQETSPRGVSFKPDGTKMYVGGLDNDAVNEYDLSTPWDISTASYVQNFSVASQDGSLDGLYFNPNGGNFFIVGAATDTIYMYNIGGFSVAAQETSPNGLFFKPDGTKMYIIGQTGDDINEYDLSTAWSVSSASYVQNFSVAAQEITPRDVFFKPDGTKMYVIGNSGDDVNEYNLSVAWDVSSASYLQNFSVATQETVPDGVFFKPDGTKMYIIGNSDNVNEYDLSSAWDISTASYLQNFSVATQETNPTGLFFKPDGTKMYIVGTAGADVNEYDLSTPWDISTASYVQNFSVAAQDTFPQGIFFRDNGEQFFMTGQTNDKVFSYLISPT